MTTIMATTITAATNNNEDTYETITRSSHRRVSISSCIRDTLSLDETIIRLERRRLAKVHDGLANVHDGMDLRSSMLLFEIRLLQGNQYPHQYL